MKDRKRSVTGYGEEDSAHGKDFRNNKQFLRWLHSVSYNSSGHKGCCLFLKLLL